MDFLIAYPWLILVGLFISACITCLWYAIYENRWPFNKLPHL
jgi:hypothetical protein